MGKSKHVAPVMAMIEARIRRLIDEERELIRAMGKKYLCTIVNGSNTIRDFNAC